jgi:exoribonuclease II
MTHGVLKNLDLADIKTPIQEVSDYLTAKFSAVKNVHPKKFEEVVVDISRKLCHRFVTNCAISFGVNCASEVFNC